MSIHIKPENRGKFNATKKRTGKTTEQLTHSKNPLTRKRAIFAQNAKKWHHAYGGNLFYDGGPDGDPTYNLGYLPEITVTPKDIINVGTKDVPVHKQRKSRSQEELNKDYLNQLITYNSNNPGGIWGDNKDAEAARKWMFKHHPAIIEGWYNNLSAKDKKNIPTKMLSQNLVKNNYMQDFGKRRHDLSKGVLQTIGGITGAGLAAGTAPAWGPAAWSAAQPWLQAAGSPLSTLAGNFAPGLQGAAGLGDLGLQAYFTADAAKKVYNGSRNPLDIAQLVGAAVPLFGPASRRIFNTADEIKNWRSGVKGDFKNLTDEEQAALKRLGYHDESNAGLLKDISYDQEKGLKDFINYKEKGAFENEQLIKPDIPDASGTTPKGADSKEDWIWTRKSKAQDYKDQGYMTPEEAVTSGKISGYIDPYSGKITIHSNKYGDVEIEDVFDLSGSLIKTPYGKKPLRIDLGNADTAAETFAHSDTPLQYHTNIFNYRLGNYGGQPVSSEIASALKEGTLKLIPSGSYVSSTIYPREIMAMGYNAKLKFMKELATLKRRYARFGRTLTQQDIDDVAREVIKDMLKNRTPEIELNGSGHDYSGDSFRMAGQRPSTRYTGSYRTGLNSLAASRRGKQIADYVNFGYTSDIHNPEKMLITLDNLLPYVESPAIIYGGRPYLNFPTDIKYKCGGKLNKKAKGGNLFANGAPIHIRDYGQEWNNKVDRLRAINHIIGQVGQQVGSMTGGSGGGFGGGEPDIKGDFGDFTKQNAQSGLDNTLAKDFNKTLNQGSTNRNSLMSFDQLSNTRQQNIGSDVRTAMTDYGSMNSNQNPVFGFTNNTYMSCGGTLFDDGGMIQNPYNKNYQLVPAEKKGNFMDYINKTGVLAPLNDKQGMAAIGQNFMGGQNGQGGQGGFDFSSMFKNMGNNAGGATAAAGAAKACGGKLHCGGGKLFDYGGDFSNGQTMYNTGGTHEENPYEGVQVGTDNQGTPNLVEEGEVRYKDYIFSNRLSLDKEMAKKYNIPKKYADATFAYIAEKMGQESKEREYDPISQRGLRADMEKLRGAQEEVKALKEQQEMMQQVQQIADELGVAPEDVLTAMQMQQQDQQQQASPEEQIMMQQQEEVPQEEVSEEEMQEMPYALGGTLFDYQGMDFSTPQRTNKLNESFPNKFGGGGDTHRLLTSKLTEQQLWNKYTKESLNNIVKEFEARYNAAKTPEEQAKIRAQFIQQFNAIQESYARMYQNGVDPRVANDIVKKHQTDFNTFGGNFGYRNIENDLNNNGRTILKDTTEAGFTPDGYRQIITDTRHLGTTAYDKELADYYKELNERLNKSGISYGLLDKDSMRYNGNELYGLSEYNPTATAAEPSTTASSPEDNDAYIFGIKEQQAQEQSNGTKEPEYHEGYHSYEQVGEPTPTNTNASTTKTNNPQAPVGGPNTSLLDFVPLWQYLTAGSPDYSQADALVDYTNRMPKTTYKPIGDFMQYHPFDRQYAANQLRAQTAAARRNNINMSAGNRGYANTANLAANYQAQLADAAMQRQADEANLAQRMQVTNFNRDTNKFNAEAFNRVQLQRPYEYQLGLQARAQRAAMHNAIDAAYSAAKSTNLNTFLNNMYNRRREAQDAARTKWMIDAGIFGEVNDPGYPYPINGNSYLDWYNIPWNRFARRTKKDTNE